MTGLLGLLSGTVSDYAEGGTEPAVRDATPEELAAAEEARGTLIEGIISESEDESLMDRYLGGEQIDVDVLWATWKQRFPGDRSFRCWPPLRRQASAWLSSWTCSSGRSRLRWSVICRR